MSKDKEAERENPATPSDPEIERRRARGQTQAQRQMRENYNPDIDPVTGQKRGPLAPHARPENQGGPVGPAEGTSPDVDDDDEDMKTHAPRGARKSGSTSSSDAEVNATDAARELAKEEGIDLNEVEGTGVDGRVTIDDVRNAAADRDA